MNKCFRVEVAALDLSKTKSFDGDPALMRVSKTLGKYKMKL